MPKIMKEHLLIIAIGVAYFFLGLQAIIYSPLITEENKMFFGMVFDLLHYSIPAIPASFVICYLAKTIDNLKIIACLFISYLLFGFYGLVFQGMWLLGLANMLIYTIWLFAFIFMVQALNKSKHRTQKC